MKLHKLFFTPVWEFEYPDWENEKEFLIRYFAQDEIYLQHEERNGLQSTRTNLHLDPKLNRLLDFHTECAGKAMSDMGFVPRLGVTSMWAARSGAGGYHHEHTHNNTFLVSVLHLYADPRAEASPIVFMNRGGIKYQMEPAHTGEPSILEEQHSMSFKEGRILVSPGWLAHRTVPTDCPYRIMTGCNFMPVGPSNKDHYGRYGFPEIVESDLKQYVRKF